MKIALIGYGKMGQAIERLATEQGHTVVLRINVDNTADLNRANLRQADVAIEFSQPESAFANIRSCLEAGVPVVSGTTGWLERLPEAQTLCQQLGGAMIHATNFSIGVNIFFALNRFLANMMEQQPQYDVHLREIHHTQKLDAPSGTAITLAEGILKALARKNTWVNRSAAAPAELSILSERTDPAPGTHEVIYRSPIDTISISHEAHSRDGFALGAIAAAAWLIGKQGVFTMQDVLGF
ncbi:MAG TPA: 4-hydroxy-tetrahydrodipicolinate reductase [Saprospiraceae bacterium]|nr:4-hydroxy-tetrahydrodipicolinate reductase [Saprospiraceae bacterium]HMP25862.1 4-hydroxy-tetrahydrodipicolinate reductase [Saprospiraceae bacterium]